MKYPTLKLIHVPQLHKAFSKPIVLHFHAICEDDLHNYKTYLLNQATVTLANQFLYNQAVMVTSNEESYILCKDNLDIDKMKQSALCILNELHKIQDRISFTFGYAKAMLMVDGYNIGIFNSNQVGDDFLESESYLKSILKEDNNLANQLSFYVMTYDEYAVSTNLDV